MSQEIDQRVVEMRFDNAQFEEHSRKTMRTLDKLKEKLRFDGAEKGIEKIQQASDDMDFSGMETGLDRLQEKFSALDVIAFTALQNITNKVMDTGEQMLKSLSVDQVTSGWDKYVEKTGNVQTIMNATGKSIDQVNGYLNKLMWYSDETSYSFDEMTSALSQMTASGGNIEKMIPMIMGIANATADAGKTGFAFQSTIRNLTQSYSAGYLQLQDWKSLNLMGTATKALKQELIDTATELGVIKKGDVTIASYENMLATVSETDPRYSYIQKDYEAFLKLNEAVEDGTLDLGHYADKMSEVSGREHLMQSLWNIWDAIAKVMGSVHDAFTEIFPPTSGEQIHSIAEGLDVVTKKLIISDDAAENLKKTFQVVFRVIKVPLNLLKTVAKAGAEAFGVLLDVLRPVGNVFLEVGAGMDDFLAEMQETILGSGTLSEKLGGITKSVKKLLDPLTSLGTVLKTSIGEKLAEVRGEISKWADSLPDGAKQAVNGLLSVLDGMVNGGLTLSGAVWNSLSGLKRMVETGLGAVADFVTGQKDTLMGYTDVLTNLPAIVGSAVTAFAEEFKGAAGNVEKTADGVFGPVKAFFTALKEGFDSISGTDIYRFMSLLDVGLLSFAIAQVGKALGSLKKMLETPLTELLNAMSGSFKGLTSALTTWQKQENTKVLTGMASALLMLAGAMFVMSKIDPERFLGVAGVTMVLIAELATVAKLLKPEIQAFDSAVSGLGSQLLKASTLWGTAAALLGLAVAVKAVCGGFTAIMDVLQKGENFYQNLGAFITVVSGMALLIRYLGMLVATLKMDKMVVGAKTLVGMGASLIALGVALRVVAGAMKPLSEINFTSLLKAEHAVVVLGGVLTGMAMALVGIQRLTDTMLVFQNGAAITAMAGGLWILAQAVGTLAGIEETKLENAMTSMKTLMVLMTALSVLSSKTHIGSGAAVLAMAGAMQIVAAAALSMTLVPVDSLKKAGAVLVGLTAAMALLGKAGANAGTGLGMMFMATAMLEMAAAILAVAGAVWVLDKAPWPGLAYAAAALGGLALAAGLLSHFAGSANVFGVGLGMMSMAAALLILAPAIRLLGEADPEHVASAMWAFATGMMAVFVGGMILTCIPELAIGLEVLAGAFKKFGQGMLYLAGATALFGVLALFADPLCQAIINAAPDIEDALVTVVTMICNVIVRCAEPLTTALVAVAMILIDTIIGILYQLWERIQPALQDIWDKATGWWNEQVKNFKPLEALSDNASGILKFLFPEEAAVAEIAKGFFDPFLDELKNGDSFASGIYKKFAGIGQNVNEGTKNGIKENKDEPVKAATEMADEMTEGTKKELGIASPSKVFEEIGRYITEGLALGIRDETALAGAKNAMQNVATAIREVFTGYWQIHSPSQLAEDDALNIAEGLALGMKDETEREKIRTEAYETAAEIASGIREAMDEAISVVQQKGAELYDAYHDSVTLGLLTTNGGYTLNRYNNRYKNTLTEFENTARQPKTIPGKTGIESSLHDEYTDYLVEQGKTGNMDLATIFKKAKEKGGAYLENKVKKMLGNVVGLTGDFSTEDLTKALLEQYDKYLPDGTDPTNPTGTGKTKSSGKSKTVAETIAEQYTKELKANKYLQDAASKEYSLWEASEGDTASTEKLIEKKGENLAASIELQTERVSIAQRQYDELLSRVGENDDKTKDARATLLDEKKNLAELKKERYETLYKAAIERYESDDETAQSEYQLWADTYEKTASVTEKSNKQIETINKRLAIQSQKTALAEKTWVETKEALGEASVEAQARYQEYLKQQQAEAELRNELAEAELDFYDKMSSRYENQLSAAKKRQSLLSTLYSDGDLSGRADAYASAVEEYGEDSIEARRAATQGTMTALMGVASAMNNMRFQLSRVTNAQKKYDAVIKQGYTADSDEALDAYSDIMDARSTFAEYMGDMADAFEVSDATKKAMMQIGDTMAKNWKNIQNGMNKVLAKVNPQVADSLKNVVGLYMRDGASETMAATANAIVAAMGGDWAGAVASGLSAVLNLVGTDFGRTLTEAISKALGLAFNGNGLFVQLLSQFFGSSGGTTTSTSGGLISNILNWGKSLLGLGKAAKTTTNLVPTLTTAASGTEGLVSSTTKMGTAVKTAAKAIAGSGGLTKVLGSLGTTLGSVGSSIMSVASSLGPHGLLVGAVIAGTAVLGTAVVKNWDKVKEYVGNAWAWIKEKASGLWDSMKEVGGNLMSGLAKGVGSVAKTAIKFAVSPAWGIISGFKKIFGIASPSKVMAQIGVYTIEGLTKGIVSTGAEAEKGMEQVADGVLASAHTVGEHIADFMASDETAQPAIRPVVDLSEAARSSAWLDSAFADRRGTISMAATVTGQMAQQMGSAAKNQNGADRETPKTQSNRDVVEAVTALGERIDGIAKAVSNMKVELNGKKLVGGIKADMNAALGSMTR